MYVQIHADCAAKIVNILLRRKETAEKVMKKDTGLPRGEDSPMSGAKKVLHL